MEKNSVQSPEPRITTLTNEVNLLDPTPDQIVPGELALALAREFRYTNHSNVPVSVAQHSVLVYALWEDAVGLDIAADRPDIALLLLLHDAHEAYTGDFSTPLKRLINQRSGGLLASIEHGLDEAIFARFGLPARYADPDHPLKKTVKKYDALAMSIETAYCFPGVWDRWDGFVEFDEGDVGEGVANILGCSDPASHFNAWQTLVASAQGKLQAAEKEIDNAVQ